MMAGQFKVGVDDDTGADLGFVLSCLALGMITMEELHQWVHHVIDQAPAGDVPPHLVAMLALKKPTSVLMPAENVMPRVPHDPFITDERFDAMLGLQFFLRNDRTCGSSASWGRRPSPVARRPSPVNALVLFIRSNFDSSKAALIEAPEAPEAEAESSNHVGSFALSSNHIRSFDRLKRC